MRNNQFKIFQNISESKNPNIWHWWTILRIDTQLKEHAPFENHISRKRDIFSTLLLSGSNQAIKKKNNINITHE